MAKGKHAPTKGAVREDKVLHPTSRKVLKMAKKVTHRYGSYFSFIPLHHLIAIYNTKVQC